MHYAMINFGDWAKDTEHLTLLEEAIYWRLIRHYYVSEKPIESARHAVRYCRAQSTQERKIVEEILREYFLTTEKGFIHKRCDSEIAKMNETSQKRREAVNKRWKKP